jgi:hypothetical protein
MLPKGFLAEDKDMAANKERGVRRGKVKTVEIKSSKGEILTLEAIGDATAASGYIGTRKGTEFNKELIKRKVVAMTDMVSEIFQKEIGKVSEVTVEINMKLSLKAGVIFAGTESECGLKLIIKMGGA